ncbi:MAG: GNAT family N-acetyltransferase [Candidatus Abyssobacteria bacterium SURF_5]|uniref:GNAT family N-acetyltransferase n=1 Tax=Abyssobacteria bacterium (strain SURF_5) TaxID=2093360 RepID=A0A3A4NCD1_ABYX5|nr:MAG: GNAT family N-acetyltransferase [Candidatus Abyssubacteria bacterium SURF_5]
MNAKRKSIEIHPVESRKDLLDFIRFPWEVYRGDTHWVPPIIKEQEKFLRPENPYFKHAEAEYYLAKVDGKICGRISMSIDQNYINFHGEKMGTFGFFEALNDHEVAARLLDTVRDRLKEKGMEVMRGPFCFTTNHESCGLLVDGFDLDPVVLTSYNPRYYVPLLEEYGLKKAKDLYSYLLKYEDVDFSYVRQLADKAAENHVYARMINLREAGIEAQRVKKVYNNAWSKNWGFVPLTDEEFEDIYRHLLMVAVEDLIYIGMMDEKPIGYYMFIPDFNIIVKKFNGKVGPLNMLRFLRAKTRLKRGRLFMLGVDREYQKTGVAAAMVVNGYDAAIRRGYTEAEFSWILEDNIATRTMCEMFGGKIYKTHRIYEMSLSA